VEKYLIILLLVFCILSCTNTKNIKDEKLETNFIYSKHIDLVFHVLAYLKVNNASDLYDAEYINKISLEKRDLEYNIIPKIISLQEYYNANFRRLTMINFLPFYCNDFDELKNTLLNFNQFSQDDIKYFINPFIEIMENESVFYFEYWEKLHKNNTVFRESIERYIKTKLKKFNSIFTYFNKSSNVFMSYSITRNGRGFSINNYFSAAIPFPETENDFQNIFFILLHEYTHQFTDNLLNNINFDDGSHNVSEIVVILADYYLIKGTEESLIPNYIKKFSGNMAGNEEDFLSYFKVEKTLEMNIVNLINSIIKK